MKKLLLILLALSLSLCAFASCGTDGGNEEETPYVTQEQNTEEEFFLNSLKKEYNAESVLITTMKDNSLGAGELVEGVDIFTEAEILRHMRAEEYFDVDINFDVFEQSDALSRMRTMANVEDGADILMHGAPNLTTLAIEGLTKDLNSVKTLDLSREWWNQPMIENTQLNNKLYTIAGGVSRFYYVSAHCMAFNKTIAAQYNIPDLYSLVQAGDWTLEEMEKITTDYGIYNEASGLYPVVFNTNNTPYGLLVGAGVKMVEIGDDSAISVSHLNNEYTKNVIERILRAVSPETNLYASKDVMYSTFGQNKALFQYASFSYSTYLPTTEVDYGIIPTPKLDSGQEKYVSSMYATSGYCSAIPARLSGDYLDWIGTFLSGYAFLGHEELRPTIQESVLKYQIAADPVASEMVDLILDGMYIDLNMIADFGGTATLIGKVLTGSMSTSNANTMFSMLTGTIQKDIDAYDALING